MISFFILLLLVEFSMNAKPTKKNKYVNLQREWLRLAFFLLFSLIILADHYRLVYSIVLIRILYRTDLYIVSYRFIYRLVTIRKLFCTNSYFTNLYSIITNNLYFIIPICIIHIILIYNISH